MIIFYLGISLLSARCIIPLVHSLHPLLSLVLRVSTNNAYFIPRWFGNSLKIYLKFIFILLFHLLYERFCVAENYQLKSPSIRISFFWGVNRNCLIRGFCVTSAFPGGTCESPRMPHKLVSDASAHSPPPK